MTGLSTPPLERLGQRVAPLSFAQERLWFIDASAPGSVTYNVPLFLRWREPLDTAALALAIGAVVRRHEALRTTYYQLENGQPAQAIHDREQVTVETIDLSGVEDAWNQARRDAERRAREPFDLAAQPPLRCVAWHGVPRADAVLLCVHHIAIDGWSLAALFQDLAQAYEAALAGEPPTLPDLPVQYADFAVWDRAMSALPATQRQMVDRVGELLEVPADLALGWRQTDVATVTMEGARPGGQYVFQLPGQVWTRVNSLAKTLRATPFVVLFAAFQVVLQRWSGREEFLVGAVTANRPHPGLEKLVGFFVNTVPLRCGPQPDWSFRQLCQEVRAEAFRSLTYQRIPFDQLMAQTTAARSGANEGRNNLANIGFALQNMPTPTLPGRPRWSPPVLLPTGTAKSDLVLLIEDGPDGVVGTVEYATDCYSPEMAHHVGEHFRALLAAAVAEPERLLPELPITERLPGTPPPGVLVGATENEMGVAQIGRPVTSVLDVLAARFAVADPAASAVSSAGERVSWGELDRWSWAVAGRLAEAGVGVGQFVPVLAARGGALVAGWVGALRSGAAYAPLGLDTPSHRLEHILSELGATTILVDQAGAALVAGLDAHLEVLRVDEFRAAHGRALSAPVRLTGGEPAVVIYTSGTTGRPKGVLVPHRGMVNTVLWWANDVNLSPQDRVLCTWSTSFDGATHEVFRALSAGAELVFADDMQRRDPRALGWLLRGPRGATVTSMTPSLLRAVLDADEGGPTTLRTLYVGGEGLPRQLAEECMQRWGVPMRNIYGPTQASCISTYAPVDLRDEQEPAIGLPLPNTRAYVLGPHQEQLPVGVPGDLYVAGAGVALGYLGQPERTEAAFLPDPYADKPGTRMYRTGDRVVLRADGLLEHLGRVDDQVKILGNRIEPNEVRKLLEEQLAVRSAAVHAVGEPRRLVAYIELADADPAALPTRDEIVRPLLRWLPAAVLPADVFVVDALPMTSNDKIDFAALGAMRSVRLPDAVARRVELTGNELRAAELFAAALGEAQRGAPAHTTVELGADVNFFMMGGHSLLAVRMLTEAELRGCGHVSLRDFLVDPTVAGLGRLLGITPVAAYDTGAVAADRFKATPAQQRFWFINRLGVQRCAYIAPAVVELTGAVDSVALHGAVESVLGRHPALRSRFELDRKLRQVCYRTDGPAPPVTLTDASGWDAEKLREQLATVCWSPFDLAGEAPARAEVLVAGDRTLLLLVAHHIVTDGWSQQLLLAQISEVYRAQLQGIPAELPAAMHPARVGVRSDDALQGRVAETVSRLRGAPTDVWLPYARRRTGVQPIAAVNQCTRLGTKLTARLRMCTGELGCTTFMLTATLLAVTLARRSAQRDFLFAFPWVGRDVPGTADVVGMFVNTLVLRVNLAGDPTWREILTRVRTEAMACYRHADVPFDAVAAALHPDRDLSRPPLTPVYISALEGPPRPPELVPTVASRYLPLEPLYVKYELELTATDHPDDLELAVAYPVELFDASTITELMAALVSGVVDLTTDLEAHPLEGI